MHLPVNVKMVVSKCVYYDFFFVLKGNKKSILRPGQEVTSPFKIENTNHL